MNPAIYVFAGSTVIGLTAAFILWKVKLPQAPVDLDHPGPDKFAGARLRTAPPSSFQRAIRGQMHPAIYVFAGSTVVGLAAAFILYKVSAAHFEKTQGSRGGGHGGCGHYQPEFTAQGPNADYRIVQTM
eukprot:CAMPEP_0177780960 /NCGR_PEP_ID=MMETSP0491_2-20121128/17546_1 /TAXON_ID=63592 /ORGANISM="Tetraselmis chuii, Strain PLY429" /LENGTH=128 /DNA_ID=CAMNT_0019300895 /DNA_START=316 /DNA_END=699 /DNA_ORIENTATION=+